MTDNFTTLDRLVELDTKGWNIDFKQLTTPRRGTYPYHYVRDELFVSADEKFACLFYTINEYRMGWEAGLIGIFQDKNTPTLLTNPDNQWFDFQGNRSFVFSDSYLFVRKLAYNENEKLSGTPFVVFDLTRKMFGFIDFDAASIYYSPVKVRDNIFRFNLDTPNEIRNLNVANRHGDEFDITVLKYYTFDQVDSLLALYFDEKKNAC
jgi:hypothetical protein